MSATYVLYQTAEYTLNIHLAVKLNNTSEWKGMEKVNNIKSREGWFYVKINGESLELMPARECIG